MTEGEIEDLKKSIRSEREEIERALKVDGYSAFLEVFDDDIFHLDYWASLEGLYYLVGVSDIRDYEGEGDTVFTLDHDFYTEKGQSHITYAFKRILKRLKRLWDSGGHAELNPPWYYIEWALSKNHEIPWLNYAIEKGFYKPIEKSTNKPKDKPLSARTENNYLRMILTLAYNIKDFDPKNPYEAAKLIIDETGIDISRQTIANYITKAYELESKNRD